SRARRRRRADGRYGPPASARVGAGALILAVAAGGLVAGHQVDAALVALLAGERLGQEHVDQRLELLLGVLAGAHRDHVRIVVLAGQARGLLVPHQRGADALDLVRGDLLAVAGAADDDAEGAGLRDD